MLLYRSAVFLSAWWIEVNYMSAIIFRWILLEGEFRWLILLLLHIKCSVERSAGMVVHSCVWCFIAVKWLHTCINTQTNLGSLTGAMLPTPPLQVVGPGLLVTAGLGVGKSGIWNKTQIYVSPKDLMRYVTNIHIFWPWLSKALALFLCHPIIIWVLFQYITEQQRPTWVVPLYWQGSECCVYDREQPGWHCKHCNVAVNRPHYPLRWFCLVDLCGRVDFNFSHGFFVSSILQLFECQVVVVCSHTIQFIHNPHDDMFLCPSTHCQAELMWNV